MATAGVIVAFVLWLAGITRAPRSTPRLGFQLYSIAGANPNTSLEPEFSWMLGGFCTPLGSRTLYPLTWVFQLRRYVASSASTHLRIRLYSQDTSTKKELPRLACPRKPASVPYTLTSATFTLFEKPCDALKRMRRMR